jgi:hypothetical protein
MLTATLAKRLGTTAHLSPLLMKARRCGIGMPEDLERLAVRRGLRYYASHGDVTRARQTAGDVPGLAALGNFSNEELALALLSLAAPYSLLRLRMGAAMLAAKGNCPEKIARLARMERCNLLVRHIAQCGRNVEPDNPFWNNLLDHLPPAAPPTRPDVLPHPTRFVAMSGLSRRGKGPVSQWIRPSPPMELV